MKNLIAMTDFAIYQNSIVGDFRKPVFYYAKFLKQPLELWMFVPCDEDGNILEHPQGYSDFLEFSEIYPYGDYFTGICKNYQQAKEKCLFEGYDGTIEQLQSLIKLKITVENMVKYDLQLTPTAVKQIGL